MNNSVAVWQPSVNGRQLSGLAVQTAGLSMNRPKYESLLTDRLGQLIEADPAEAQDVLTSSPETFPDLYQIAKSTPLREWPLQIVMSDQMQTCLARIDYPQGRRTSLRANELPCLRELVESIPQQ